MKRLTITALLALFLCAPLPTLAADWSIGYMACDMKDIELSNPLVFWNWGTWVKFDVKFYSTADPNASITFRCYVVDRKGDLRNEEYKCFLNSGIPDYFKAWKFNTGYVQYTFKPGTTQAQVCNDVFLGIRFSR